MYAIFQQGFAIFGTGHTVEEALTDAEQWSDGKITLGNKGVHGDFIAIPCTDNLVKKVADDGGEVAVWVNDAGELDYDPTLGNHGSTQPDGTLV